ncbi:MAG: GNAT family N-acetyltransferase [Paludibacteraceae bacterium]
MKPEFEDIPLIKNEVKQQFQIDVNGHFAYIVYEETLCEISLIHTEVEQTLEGTGAASAVVEKTLHYIENTGKKLLPYCPYVFSYIKKHSEWKRLVYVNFPGYENL